MATITSDTYLDDAPRTAGESWTLNGATLTVRTDTRWHAGSPASMTGSMGHVTGSAVLGGKLLIDGRDVRWMPFDTGSGNVPAIGTSITQGGVSGYLLGVWADFVSAPTAVGAAMPSTGFLKFREVTGAFAVGALTGIGASATAADGVGWIEVVCDQAANLTFYQLGDGVVVRGREDFVIGTTNGLRGQTFQVPTNGGGAGTLVPGCEIETAPGSGVFEYYPAIYGAAFNWDPAKIATDTRAKLVEAVEGGVLRIGSDGTFDVGHLPPSGCLVRIPNVIGRQCTTAARASNALPHTTLSSRPEYILSGSGKADIQNFINDWNNQFNTATVVKIKNLITTDRVYFVNINGTVEVDGLCAGNLSASAAGSVYNVDVSNCTLNGFLKNVTAVRYHAESTVRSVVSVANVFSVNSEFPFYLSNIKVMQTGRRLVTDNGVNITNCKGVTLSDIFSWGGRFIINQSSDCHATDVDYIDRMSGGTDTTVESHAITVASSSFCTVDGITIGNKGEIANTHPYGRFVSAVTNVDGVVVKNAGTRAAPLNCGADPLLFPIMTVYTGSSESSSKFQRLYISGTRQRSAQMFSSGSNLWFESVFGDTAGSIYVNGSNNRIKGCSGLAWQNQNSVVGANFIDAFTSDLQGRIVFAANEPTSSTPTSLVLAGTTGGWTATGSCLMPTVGDQIVAEADYSFRGHTGITGVAYSNFTNQANFNIEYQTNSGAGWSAWDAIANITAETVPATGWKVKFRITTVTSAIDNVAGMIILDTSSTLAAQSDNLHPLYSRVIELRTSGLLPNTRVRVYNLTQSLLVRNEYVASGEFSFSFNLYQDGLAAPGDLLQLHACKTGYLGYQTIAQVPVGDVTFVVDQEVDDIYVANDINGAAVGEYYFDGVNAYIDADDLDGESSIQRLYAWYNDELTTEEGINLLYGVIDALNQETYRVNADVLPLLINNLAISPLRLSGGYLYRNDGASVISPVSNSLWIDNGYVPPPLGRIKTTVEVAIAEAGIATSAQVGAIPTNPLLTTDARLDNLDAAVSSRSTLAGIEAATLKANVTQIRGLALVGTGVEGDEFGVAE